MQENDRRSHRQAGFNIAHAQVTGVDLLYRGKQESRFAG
jgi:hypothetical protein